MSDFGSNLSHLRQLRGWSQAELGRRCAMGPSQIGHYENGIQIPILSSVVRIAAALRVSLDDLVGTAGKHPRVCAYCRGAGVVWAHGLRPGGA